MLVQQKQTFTLVIYAYVMNPQTCTIGVIFVISNHTVIFVKNQESQESS
jgi:hypothetical protein